MEELLTERRACCRRSSFLLLSLSFLSASSLCWARQVSAQESFCNKENFRIECSSSDVTKPVLKVDFGRMLTGYNLSILTC